MTRTYAVSMACVASLTLAACRTGAPGTATTRPSAEAVAAANDVTAASATLRDAAGHDVGSAQLTSDEDGTMHLVVSVRGLAPGSHGIHFHAVGACDATGATAFASAGGHFNPISRQHGLDNPAGPHAGDLPNLVVGTDSAGTLDVVTPRATLRSGPASLFDADGTALVIHAGVDDQHTDPSGGSGARIACGVVEGKM